MTMTPPLRTQLLPEQAKATYAFRGELSSQNPRRAVVASASACYALSQTDRQYNPVARGEPTVFLYKPSSLPSRAIAWQSDSPYSHASFRFSEFHVIHALAGFGVTTGPLPHRGEAHGFSVMNLEPQQWAIAAHWMFTQLGTPYDYEAALRFVTRGEPRPNQRWQCAELVVTGLKKAGCRVLQDVDPSTITPGELYLSPSLARFSDDTRPLGLNNHRNYERHG